MKTAPLVIACFFFPLETKPTNKGKYTYPGNQMKFTHRFLLITLLAVDLAAQQQPASDSMRTWTDSTGRKIEASLHGFQDQDNLILKLADGRLVPFPILKLGPADKAFAVDAYGKQPSGGAIDWKSPKKSPNYVIRGLARKNAPGFISVKAGWEYQIKSIEAKLQYKGEKKIASGNVVAYFYDREGKLIERVAKPPVRQNEDRVYVDVLDSFEKGESVEAYYPLSAFLEESGWATVLVAFGDGSDYSVDTMPATSYENLAFDEKKYVFPDWVPDATGSSPATPTMTNTTLEVRRIREDVFADSLIFNGRYQSRMPCVGAEVRATGEIVPGDGAVKLYAFDKTGKLAGSRMTPSSAEIDGSGKYVGLPRIANDDWHPVYFALDGNMEGNTFPTYVVVFAFGGKTIASIQTSNGSVIEALDFPEKSQLTK